MQTYAFFFTNYMKVIKIKLILIKFTIISKEDNL